MMQVIPGSTARQMVSQGAQLVDVRTPEEYAKGSAQGAVNIPLQQIMRAANELDFAKPVVLFCASGGRSGQASIMLQGLGFSQIHNAGSLQNILFG